MATQPKNLIGVCPKIPKVKVPKKKPMLCNGAGPMSSRGSTGRPTGSSCRPSLPSPTKTSGCRCIRSCARCSKRCRAPTRRSFRSGHARGRPPHQERRIEQRPAPGETGRRASVHAPAPEGVRLPGSVDVGERQLGSPAPADAPQLHADHDGLLRERGRCFPRSDRRALQVSVKVGVKVGLHAIRSCSCRHRKALVYHRLRPGRRGGRVVDCTGLLNRRGGECFHRGFESLPLRSPQQRSCNLLPNKALWIANLIVTVDCDNTESISSLPEAILRSLALSQSLPAPGFLSGSSVAAPLHRAGGSSAGPFCYRDGPATP